MNFRTLVRDVPDFPAPGLHFKDLTPLLFDAQAFREAVDAMAEPVINLQPTHVLGLESRGFIFGSALAQKLGLGFVPARKAGKLPGATFSQALEGGGTPEALEIPQDAFKAGDRVLIVDDALATGRTAAAARALVERSGAHPVALTLFMELELQQGRNRLEGMPVFSLVRFSDAAPGLAHQA